MQAINQLLYYHFNRRNPQIQQWINNGCAAQLQVFNQLLKTAKNTAWGKMHAYAAIQTVTDFKQQVPLNNYESLYPYIQLMMRGNANVLWPGSTKWFAKSSGTTSKKSKFIPMSRQSMWQCHFKGSSDTMALYCKSVPNTQLYKGKCLVLGGSHRINELNAQARYGDLSAVLMQNIPKVGHYIRTPNTDVSLLENWEEKLARTAEVTIPQNITHFAGVPTWLLVLFERILAQTGKSNLLEVWPNLELYLHGGVSFVPYKAQFEQLIPNKKMHYWETYNASEGFFAMQDAPNRDDMLLMLDHGIFYEFMPLSELGKSPKEAQTLQLNEVQTGVNYALVISSNAGLWRYMIGDTIKFTTLNPFRIQITGRTQQYINAFGEEVIVANADLALSRTCQSLQVKVREYTVAPIYFGEQTNGAHEWLIEFETMPKKLSQFTTLLDQNLQQVNSDYEAKRFNSIAMKLPIVQAVPNGTFYAWLERKGKLGGQHKVPRLANNRGIIEEIKRYL